MAANGNIIGENFSPSVIEQINTRQNKLKQDKRNQDIITWSNSSTAFLRLSSCVNLDTGGEGANNNFQQEEIRNQALNIAQALGDTSLGGSELARRAVLWNGLTPIKNILGGDTYFPKSGINNNNPDSIWNSSAYGFGGNDLGYRPMPGLTGATLTYYNMGTLKKAVIQAKAFNVKQLEIMDLLYMRLGYNILLEWGHTIYFDNKGEKQNINNLITIPFEMIFPINNEKPNNVFEVLEGIEKERKDKSYNYDAFFGQVSKFNWSFNEEGTYDIVIEAMSHGDVIESLKINNNYPTIKQTETTTTKDTIDREDDILGEEILKRGYQFSDGSDEKVKGLTSSDFTTTAGVKQTQFDAIAGNEIELGEIEEGIENIEENSNFKLKSLFERHFIEIKNKLKFKVNTPITPLKNYEESTQYIKYRFATSKDADTNQYYVKLGVLLNYIQNNLLIYNEENKSPYVKIDTNPDENFCLSFDNHFSTNPLVCIIPFKYGLKSPTRQQEDSLENVTLTNNLIPGDNPFSHINFSPKRTLNVIQEDNDTNFESYASAVTTRVTKKTGTQFLVPNNPYVGKLMHIHVNIDYLLNLMDGLKNEKGDVNLFQFLQTTMDDIANSLGNINTFNVTYDPDTNYLKIYDNNNLNYSNIGDKTKENEVANFESYGISENLGGSFLKSINFNVTISNNFASLITIGAQANSNVSGVNSTGLNSLNRGLIDRVFPKKVDIGKIEGDEVELNYDLNSIMKAAYSIYIDGNITLDNLKDINNGYVDYCKDEINEAANLSYIPSPFFLPFELKISMLGLSGVKNYQKFKVQEDILPSTYKANGKDSKIEFIAKGVTHEIKDNKWTSTLDALTVPTTKLNPFPPIGGKIQDFSIEPPTSIGHYTMSVKLQAILDTIAWAEGTIRYGQNEGYDVLFGGGNFGSFNDHPWNIKPLPPKVYFDNNGKKDWSTASGRYQFLKGTWSGLVRNNQLSNFNSVNQDIGAILLASSKKGFINYLEDEDYELAFGSIKEIWASLPSAGYGQPEKPLVDTLNYFNSLLTSNKSLDSEVETWLKQNRSNILAEGKTS